MIAVGAEAMATIVRARNGSITAVVIGMTMTNGGDRTRERPMDLRTLPRSRENIGVAGVVSLRVAWRQRIAGPRERSTLCRSNTAL